MSEEKSNQNEVVSKQNREISWLRFNERVLEEADDTRVPILERLKFLSIFATNLDEFFMIRVGSLYDALVYSPTATDNKSGLTPGEQLSNIYTEVDTLNQKFNDSYTRIEAELRSKSISSLDFEELHSSDEKFAKSYFKETIYPLLSPQIVDPHHPFPHLNNKAVYIVCLLKHKSKTIFGIVPIPDGVPQFIFLPGKTIRYIHVEKIILEFLDKIFDSYQIEEKACISVTRNADITSDDDSYTENADFRKQMKKLLNQRKKLAVVRLEASRKLSTDFSDYLCENLSISGHQIYVTRAPLRMDYVLGLINSLPVHEVKGMLYLPYIPASETSLSGKDMMRIASRNDMLFHYPYMSIKPFLNLVRQAANDPNVISIRITIYRLAMKATIVDYLCTAAENGKDVTVLIELRARFDEQNNIDWSEKLEDAGCKVIYGFEEFKVHSKICLITYRDKGKIKYITQIGTGNYNERTAELYTDLSLITGNDEIGLDATEYFKNMSVGNLEGQYRHLLVAPFSLKPCLLSMIDEEIQKGKYGEIFLKLNAITDNVIINKLAEASNAGVRISMVVRGICCILPGVPGMTENIKIKSIVGRFLEHSRIYSFGVGDSQKLFISSADFMTRNLDRRVEVACPIYDPEIKRQINEIIELIQYNNVTARMLDSSGNYNKITDNRIAINSQEQFMIQSLQKNSGRSYRNTVKYDFNSFKEYIKDKFQFLRGNQQRR